MSLRAALPLTGLLASLLGGSSVLHGQTENLEEWKKALVGKWQVVFSYTKKAAAETKSFSDRLKAAIDQMRAKNLEAAITTLKSLQADFPDRAICDYNLACACALQKKKNSALKLLDAAVEKGYDDVVWMREDSDLALIRGEKEFSEILGKARTRFLDRIEYHIQENPSYSAKEKSALLIYMGGAGSDGLEVDGISTTLLGKKINDLLSISEGRLKAAFLMGNKGQAYAWYPKMMRLGLPRKNQPFFKVMQFSQDSFRHFDDRIHGELGEILLWLVK
jgi:hypothetical protein